MKEQKIKTYNIMLSRVFPKTHPRAGQPTGFDDRVMACFRYPSYNPTLLGNKKLHTIRANYALWKERFDEVQRGEAIINLRQWLGEPYRSKTVLIKTLTAADGIGLQRLDFKMPDHGDLTFYVIDESMVFTTGKVLSHNDGLELQDWLDWFSDYDQTQPLAIIHFTPFRYTPSIEL